MKMITIMDRIVRWMQGIGHGRGFGVQSPTAYRFLREVVCARLTPADLASLPPEWHRADRRERLTGALCYRLARHVCPDQMAAFGAASDLSAACMKVGWPDGLMQRVEAGRSFDDYGELLSQLGTVRMVCVSLAEGADAFVEHALDHADERSVFLIEDIWRDRLSRLWWDELRQDPRVGVTFDLYVCGLLTFNMKVFKRNYLVNL